ncbi:MAG: hypothetical protein WC055_02280 [Melioribacteraceae bacterium]
MRVITNIAKRDKDGNIMLDEFGTPIMEALSDVEVAISFIELQESMLSEVDSQTQSNIRLGFTFDGIVFSMSENAQLNWSNIPNIPKEAFPFEVSGKEDDVYLLSEANKMNFYMTAMSFKMSLLSAGTSKKKLIKACKTIEDLKKIV